MGGGWCGIVGLVVDWWWSWGVDGDGVGDEGDEGGVGLEEDSGEPGGVAVDGDGVGVEAGELSSGTRRRSRRWPTQVVDPPTAYLHQPGDVPVAGDVPAVAAG